MQLTSSAWTTALALLAASCALAVPWLFAGQHGGSPPKQGTSSGRKRYNMDHLGVEVLDPMCINDSLDYSHFRCPEPPLPLRPIVFLKTHKTGSTSVSGIVFRLADRRNLPVMLSEAEKRIGGRTFDYPNAFPGAEQEPPAEEPHRRYHAVAQHAVYNGPEMRSYVRPNPFFLSIIREPGAQLLSAYNFVRNSWSKMGWEPLVDFLNSSAQSKRGSIDAALFLNPQAHDFGWYEHTGHTRAHDRNATRVREWLDSLTGDFVDNGMVLMLEHYDEGMVLLRRRLSLTMHDLVGAKSRASTYAYINKTRTALEQARSVLPVDLELYEHFNRTFWAQWTAEDGPELRAELAKFKALDSKVKSDCQAQPRDYEGCPARTACGNGVTCAYYIAITRAKSKMRCIERNG